MDLLAPYKNADPVPFHCSWRSPSNIAFVKYWGKKGHQLPANPSLSMTLKECYTETKVEFIPGKELKVELFLSGVKEDRFAKKIYSYLEGLTSSLNWLKDVALKIETSNTFPHGAGIASSASGLSALGLCLADYLRSMSRENKDQLFYRRASHLSRLASGSACRSVYGGFVSWGESELSDSSDLWATPFEVHKDLVHLQDSVVIISNEEKSVSSRAGHERMKEHVYAQARYGEAWKNYSKMLGALRSGDMESLGEVLENEAFQLHAMMMASPSAFTLLRPNSLAAMEMVRDFRQQTKLPLYFTLDAGPNLHLIYPESQKAKILTFINHELGPMAQKIIDDQRGEGPVECK